MVTGILSTKNFGTLTAQQHAIQMIKSGLDFCQLDYGDNFSFEVVGLTLKIGSGMGQCFGRTFQFTNGTEHTISANKNFRLIVRVNLATGTANALIEEYVGVIPEKTFSDDIVNNILGTHDVEIGRGTSTSTTVSFTKTITLNNSITNNMNENFQTPKITAFDGMPKYSADFSMTRTLQQIVNELAIGIHTIELHPNSPANPTTTHGIATIEKFRSNSTTNTNGFSTGTLSNVSGEVYSLKNAFGTNVPFWETLFPVISVGTIVEFAGEQAPNGWLMCDGSTKLVSEFKKLYEVIGNRYGPAISGVFVLPDKRGRVSVGLDVSQIEFDELGKSGGSKTHTLTTEEIPSHTHKNSVFTYVDRQKTPATFTNISGSGSNWMTTSGQVQGGTAVETTGGGQSHNNIQPYITTNFIIKY